MKKLSAVFITAAVICTLSFSGVSAQNGNGEVNRAGQRNCGNGICQYMDENQDGICDNAKGGCSFIDEDGDGICDNAGVKQAGTGNGRKKLCRKSMRSSGRNCPRS